ncbi:MAG: L,D-transpeptidase [Bacteroidetes bacterium]|nr:L,D-transpeptidase [Bacteroidota bacterium]
MSMQNSVLSRRDFLKLWALGLAGLAFRPFSNLSLLTDFPKAERLARVAATQMELKAAPDENSATLRMVYHDAVFPILKEVVGPKPGRINQSWVDTGEGYLWSAELQPVRNIPDQPVDAFPVNAGGMWVEVTIPYVNLIQENPPARSPRFSNLAGLGQPLRYYYSQIVWADQIKIESGQTWYRVQDRYGSYGDIFWAQAEAFRPLSLDEIAPIHPEMENKSILINIAYQTLSCFEGDTEVYFARVSTGALFDAWGNRVDVWSTPIGAYPIWRKLFALNLSGGGALDGWDLPAVGWTSLFVGSGVAIHSTYWHNNYGEPSSRGCVNCSPDDAKWIFRWAQPVVSYEPGDLTVSIPGGTVVRVVEG